MVYSIIVLRAVDVSHVQATVVNRKRATGILIRPSQEGVGQVARRNSIAVFERLNSKFQFRSSFFSGVSVNTVHYSEVGLINLDVQDSNYGGASRIKFIFKSAVNAFDSTSYVVPNGFCQFVACFSAAHLFICYLCFTGFVSWVFINQRDMTQ